MQHCLKTFNIFAEFLKKSLPTFVGLYGRHQVLTSCCKEPSVLIWSYPCTVPCTSVCWCIYNTCQYIIPYGDGVCSIIASCVMTFRRKSRSFTALVLTRCSFGCYVSVHTAFWDLSGIMWKLQTKFRASLCYQMKISCISVPLSSFHILQAIRCVSCSDSRPSLNRWCNRELWSVASFSSPFQTSATFLLLAQSNTN
jgi:hypothetical protein